jgi:hypothetical protein
LETIEDYYTYYVLILEIPEEELRELKTGFSHIEEN